MGIQTREGGTNQGNTHESANRRLMNHLGFIGECLRMSKMIEMSIHTIASKRVLSVEAQEDKVRHRYDAIFAMQRVLDELESAEVDTNTKNEILSTIMITFESEYAYKTVGENIKFLGKILTNVEEDYVEAIKCINSMNESTEKFAKNGLRGISYNKTKGSASGLESMFQNAQEKIETIQAIFKSGEEILEEMQIWAEKEKQNLDAIRKTTGLELSIY